MIGRQKEKDMEAAVVQGDSLHYSGKVHVLVMHPVLLVVVSYNSNLLSV